MVLVLAGCGTDPVDEAVLVRHPDDQQVMTPGEVAQMRTETGDANERTASGEGGATGDTIPLEDVDPTERLFTSFGEFTKCMDDNGQPFRGDPRSDPSLLEDREYMDVISTCAARSDILGALTAFQEFNDGLSPDEVKDRNEQFIEFSACLEEREWTIEAAPNEKGLLTPSVFRGPDGSLDERDLRQCGNEIQSDE
jgi:hypothetical protein